MTDPEVISDEALEIIGQHDGGLTAVEIYDKSRMAMSLNEVTGALSRLRNARKVVRGTDKRWRRLNGTESGKASAAEKDQQPSVRLCPDSGAPCDAPECRDQGCKIIRSHQKPKPRPEPISREAAVEAVKKVAGRQPKTTRQIADEIEGASRVFIGDRIGSDHWLVDDLEKEATAAQVRLDRYISELGDPILAHLVELAIATNKALEAAREVHP